MICSKLFSPCRWQAAHALLQPSQWLVAAATVAQLGIAIGGLAGECSQFGSFARDPLRESEWAVPCGAADFPACQLCAVALPGTLYRIDAATSG